MARITPIRKVKEGARGTYYESRVRCGKITITVYDGDDDYPCRVTAQYTDEAGCTANMNALQRVVTLYFESNCRAEPLIEQLRKVKCPSCQNALIKGDKDIALSCARAMGDILHRHINNGETKKE